MSVPRSVMTLNQEESLEIPSSVVSLCNWARLVLLSVIFTLTLISFDVQMVWYQTGSTHCRQSGFSS